MQIPLQLIASFGLLLVRMTGLLTFLPIPGLRSGLELHRLVLGVLFTVLLLPWIPPTKSTDIYALGEIIRLAVTEAALGLAIGLCIALIQEGLALGTHMVSMQAGFSYASTIDPTSNADSAIIQVLINMSSALLFLALGIDTILFRFLLRSVEAVPPGHWTLTSSTAGAVMALFPPLFVDGIRWALPVVAILLVIDAALALLSRIQPQLQLLSLSFPIKMLAAMALIAAGAPMLPGALERASIRSFEVMQAILATAR
ncbi:MAG TPA: flagellar biosynthetic protein FliR [Bryobacteraceae bacterium]|nr:flagellar biosynthetic protein FliR [Bryobacteraceae bacterium]